MVKELILMVGIPGSGKTTLRQKLFPDAKIVCPDENIGYNEEDPWTFARARKAWKKADSDLRKFFYEENTIVFDATFVSPKKRKKYINLAKEKDFKVIAVFCSTPLDIALERNNARDKWRKIPEKVIIEMFNNLRTPSKEEGFEKIIVHTTKEK